MGVLGYNGGIFVSRHIKCFGKKKNDFFTRRLASFYKHIVFFSNLSDPPPYLWNHFGKVPLFLGKREKNVIVSPTSCYSQEKS